MLEDLSYLIFEYELVIMLTANLRYKVKLQL